MPDRPETPGRSKASTRPEPPARSEFTRAIRVPHAVAMVVGTIIGASIFVQPSEVTSHVPTVGGIYAVWIVSGVLTLFGALVCAEWASRYPASGGVYVYLREAFSPAVGFLWGWAMFWTVHSGIIAVVAMVCARYVGYFVELGDWGLRGVAIAVILVLSVVNCFGVRQGARLQTAFTVGKVAAVIVIIVLGFGLGGDAHERVAAAPIPSGDFTPGDFALALVAGLFAFGGWHMVTYAAEETEDPRRTLPRALLVGTLLVTGCYVLLNAVYLHVLPLDVVASSERVAADAADAVLGGGGGALMSGLVIFSTFGALAGIILAGQRVYHAMARDGLLFAWFTEIHPVHRTPQRAIALQGVWSSALVLTGTYRELFTRVIYTEWIFFGLLAVGLIVVRRRGEGEAPFEVPGYPVIPIVFTVAAFGIAGNHMLSVPLDALVGLGVVLMGLPIYGLWARRQPRARLSQDRT